MSEHTRYHAFISYSHPDQAVAVWLHRALEGYRVPARLVGSSGRFGPVPERLRPIFRDRDELPAAGDLGEEIREALAGSKFLIVIGSPAAARSRWVAAEVQHFKQLHGNDRILGLIASGEPFASRLPGREAEECFPEALRFKVDGSGAISREAAEPIAADLRPGGDGRRLALMKLVSGLLGLRLDLLVQRESQRRAARLRGIAVASSLLAAAMAGLAAVAVHSRDLARQARAESEQRRDQAEGLIEFMLGDLRDRLEPVGRLDVLDSVGERALRYYGERPAAYLAPDELGRRSRAQLLIGEIHELRGDLDSALSAFRDASLTTAELLERAPDDGQRVFDHAQSLFWVGYIAWQRGDRETAGQSFLEYRNLAERLVALDPAKPEWTLELAYAERNLGTLALENGDPQAARSAFSRSLAAVETLPDSPDHRLERAQCHGWSARALEALGKLATAITERQKQQALLMTMNASGTDWSVTEAQVVSHLELGRLKVRRGELSEARPELEAALALGRQLLARDPSNRFWQAQQGWALVRHAEGLRLTGDEAGAAHHLEEASALIDQLVQADATVLDWRINLRGTWLAQRAALKGPTGTGVGSETLQGFLTESAQALAESGAFREATAEVIGQVALALGDREHRSGRPEPARAHWTSGLAALRSGTGELGPQARMLVGLSALRLGELEEAVAQTQHLLATDFRHPDFQALLDGTRLALETANPVQSEP